MEIFSVATRSDYPAATAIAFDDFSENRSSSKTITLLRPRSTSYIGFIRDYRKKGRRFSRIAVINLGSLAQYDIHVLSRTFPIVRTAETRATRCVTQSRRIYYLCKLKSSVPRK